jgi:hypothetical protein
VIFAAKLVLVPLFIAPITLAGMRFGPRAAGVLTGLPVVAGPIVLFLALEQGASFATRSATATLAGEGSLAAFCIVYAGAAPTTSWWTSTALGWAAFLASTLVLDVLDPALPLAAAIALAAPLLVLALTPRPHVARLAGDAVALPELAVRMTAGVLLMLAVTGLAHVLGPRLAGLLTVFPIATTILAAFSHRTAGASFAIRLLRGLAAGLYSLTAFFLTLALGLAAWGTILGFTAAAAAALATQGAIFAVARRRAQSQA